MVRCTWDQRDLLRKTRLISRDFGVASSTGPPLRGIRSAPNHPCARIHHLPCLHTTYNVLPRPCSNNATSAPCQPRLNKPLLIAYALQSRPRRLKTSFPRPELAQGSNLLHMSRNSHCTSRTYMHTVLFIDSIGPGRECPHRHSNRPTRSTSRSNLRRQQTHQTQQET